MTFTSAMGRIGQIESTIGGFHPQPQAGSAQPAQGSSSSSGGSGLAEGFARASGSGPQPTAGAAGSGTDFEALMRVLSFAEDLASEQRSPGSAGSSPSASGAAAASSSSGVTAAAGSRSSGGVTGNDVLAAAQQHHGVPYRWGGTSPSSGLDCSGLVQIVMGELGISVPRVAADQARQGREVASLSEAEPGDLIVTRNGGHIGVYAGDGEWTHSPRPGRSVVTEPISGNIMTIRRLADSPSEAAASAAAQAASADRSSFESQMSGAGA
ncbi:C40 family peptidase [Nesterenkonia populi]|uniref:C40 family peptidase n=1 Tax=Nesterenkonia populi TaxID=1591087 RepID=UPI0011BE2C23|nr:C40 family peptidase [Nesterenkonia populi]